MKSILICIEHKFHIRLLPQIIEMSNIYSVIMVIVSPNMAKVTKCAVNFVLRSDFNANDLLALFCPHSMAHDILITFSLFAGHPRGLGHFEEGLLNIEIQQQLV